MKKLQLDVPDFLPFLKINSGHLQTILGHIIPSHPTEIQLFREEVGLQDGDRLSVHYHKGSSDTVVAVFHGLGGNSFSDYMLRTADIALKKNHSIVLVNHRGADPLVPSKKSYHSGRGEDAEAVVSWMREKFPGKKLVTVGFSMSGSILLNLLTKRHGVCQPDFAVIVNAPLDLKTAAYNLTKGLNRVYDLRFYLILKPIVEKRLNQKLSQTGRTIDIDELYTAPLNGYSGRDDYYVKCSTKDYLDRITTKTFVLSSEDDPFIDVTDYRLANWPDLVHLTIQKSGGHMGYFSQERHPNFGHRWLDHYLDAVLEKIAII